VSVTAAGGFRAAGVVAGLKASGGRDVALVVNDGPSDAAAAVFTRNRVQAAPVIWSRQAVADGRLRVLALNSGGANACTGSAGFADTHATAEHVAAVLDIGAGDVAVCSTGLIGERLPMDALLAGVTRAAAALDKDGGPDAADAIRTTDTVAKQAVHVHADGWTVGGMAKGAGMLAPSLATMLCVITTDAAVSADRLDVVLHDAVRRTFERVDADGCLSTNDTVILLASGASGIPAQSPDLDVAVEAVCADLAGQLVDDAEGATKHVAVVVSGAASEDDAVEVGRAIARNDLLKCALFGNDPNWAGRGSGGTTSAAFGPDRLMLINGRGLLRARPSRDRSISPASVTIAVDLHAGAASSTIHTTDLSYDYVHINSAYPT
jgi:glutamate N-acetyltransferase/amino-acid N-acetyltransferase